MRTLLKEIFELNKEIFARKKYINNTSERERKSTKLHIKRTIEALEDQISEIEADITFQSGVTLSTINVRRSRLRLYLKKAEKKIDKYIGKETPLYRYNQDTEPIIQQEQERDVIIID